MANLLEKLLALTESTIDYAREDLDPVIWIHHEDGQYSLHPGAERQIIRALDSYPDLDLRSLISDIRIAGSITTNQYTDDTDVDVHLVPRDLSQWSEEDVKKVGDWFDDNRRMIGGFIGLHPIEVYIQLNPSQDLLSDGAYDVTRKTWLKEPKLVPLDYDPYQDFSSIESELRSVVEDADLLFGELKRDVIDYDTIKSAMDRMSPDQRQHFLTHLESKLQEIEDDIEALYRVKGELVQKRKQASTPASPEQALQDAELAKKWRDTNALFKFVDRYRYLKVINDLKKLLDDEGEVSPDDIQTIKHITGVPDVS